MHFVVDFYNATALFSSTLTFSIQFSDQIRYIR